MGHIGYGQIGLAVGISCRLTTQAGLLKSQLAASFSSYFVTSCRTPRIIKLLKPVFFFVKTPMTAQLCSWVGHEDDCANHPSPHHTTTPPTTTETQHQSSGAPEEHLLTTP